MLHVDIPTRDDLQALLLARHPAIVTICLPTTPVTAHTQADRIALKYHTADAVRQLEHHDKREVRALEESLHDLVDDDVFWEFQANSLVVLATPAHAHTYRLPNRLSPSL